MQEVFEKIIEELNSKKAYFQRFYECEGKSEYDADLNKSTQLAFDDAIEIVKQEAEKYNNGWIPCSERLPEEPEITGDVEEDISNGKLNEYIGMIYGAEKPTILYYAGERCWYDEVSQDYYPVRAWQPLPEPYQPNACKDTDCPYNDGNECPAADGCAGYERKRTNFDMCCESMEAMAQIIDIAKIGWTKEKIMEWLQSEVEE